MRVLVTEDDGELGLGAGDYLSKPFAFAEPISHATNEVFLARQTSFGAAAGPVAMPDPGQLQE